MPKIEYLTRVEGLSYVEDAKPIQYSKIMPDWFKNMPNFIDSNDWTSHTARKCPSFTDLFKYSYVLRAWTDYKFTFVNDDEWGWETPSGKFSAGGHPNWQYLDHIGPHKYRTSLKLDSPWMAKLPKGYSLLQIPLIYSPHPNFDTIPGILHSDVYHGTNPQLLIKDIAPGQEFQFTLTRGTPIVSHIPIRREGWELEVREGGGLLSSITSLVSSTKFKDSYRLLTKGFIK